MPAYRYVIAYKLTVMPGRLCTSCILKWIPLIVDIYILV